MTTNNSIGHSPDIEATTCTIQLFMVTINLGSLPYFDDSSIIPTCSDNVAIRPVRFHSDHIVDGFPLLFCASRLPDALEMNLFMQHRYLGKFLRPKRGGNRNLLGGVTVGTLENIANSLRCFLAWLANTKTDWHEVYAVADGDKAKAWLPPYRYRAYLISQVEIGKLKRDTANLYINHVRQFYEWAFKMGRIARIPFKYKRITIKKKRKDGDFDLLFSSLDNEKTLTVETTDLVIPKKYKSKQEDSLTPYTSEELKWLFHSHHMHLDSRKLWAELALICGLRAAEVASFPEKSVINPALSQKNVFQVKIVGKFNKERTILVPASLMESLWKYKNSEERLHRAAKWDFAHGVNITRPLFLNRSGKGINSASLTNITSCVVKELVQKGVIFSRSFHDLRATFATMLAKFMLEKNLSLGFIQYKLMSLMGHANFSSTEKYINFARTTTFEKQTQDWVDRIFTCLRPELEVDANSTGANT